jgi:hypothetical protein
MVRTFSVLFSWTNLNGPPCWGCVVDM